jgi:hypothetical protein
MATTTTTFSLSTFVLSHLPWVVLMGALVVGFYSWRGEHDARILAEATIKASQAQITTLQEQIVARDKATTAQVAPIVQIIHDTTTTQQAAAALPKVLTQPLPTPIIPQADNSVVVPQPDVIPLFDQVADDSVCRALLTTAQADLTDTKGIVVQQTTEIVALKKKPSFWKRVGSTVKTVGIGIGIGVVLGTKL